MDGRDPIGGRVFLVDVDRAGRAGLSAGISRAQPAMNSSAFGSRSRSRNGVGSSELKICFRSATCTSISAQPGGNPSATP